MSKETGWLGEYRITQHARERVGRLRVTRKEMEAAWKLAKARGGSRRFVCITLIDLVEIVAKRKGGRKDGR